MMLDWLGNGGDVSIFDATNTTSARRRAVLARCEARSPDLRVIFLESICDDERVLELNYKVSVTAGCALTLTLFSCDLTQSPSHHRACVGLLIASSLIHSPTLCSSLLFTSLLSLFRQTGEGYEFS